MIHYFKFGTDLKSNSGAVSRGVAPVECYTNTYIAPDLEVNTFYQLGCGSPKQGLFVLTTEIGVSDRRAQVALTSIKWDSLFSSGNEPITNQPDSRSKVSTSQYATKVSSTSSITQLSSARVSPASSADASSPTVSFSSTSTLLLPSVLISPNPISANTEDQDRALNPKAIIIGLVITIMLLVAFFTGVNWWLNRQRKRDLSQQLTSTTTTTTTTISRCKCRFRSRHQSYNSNSSIAELCGSQNSFANLSSSELDGTSISTRWKSLKRMKIHTNAVACAELPSIGLPLELDSRSSSSAPRSPRLLVPLRSPRQRRSIYEMPS